MSKLLRIVVVLLFVSVQVMAQNRNVSGIVRDRTTGEPIAGVNVVVKGTGIGTASDAEGKFLIGVPDNANTLIFSFVGYVTTEVTIPSTNVVDVSLESAAGELEEVVISVGRGSQRTITDTPLPVDVLSSENLVRTGQITFDKALQYRVPAFNTVQTPVNDATSLLDPYEIRNMGPSRTLILINGKRKNTSSLIYTQTSPGRGETGADISAIPADAVKRVEILRDGASAQYGSDAIAGVMNIILKDDRDDGSFTLRTGITSEGDGEMIGLSLNNGTNLGNRGFLNYTIDFSKVGLASRSGKVDGGTSNLGAEDRPLSGGEYADFVYVDPDNPDNYPGGIITVPLRNQILADNAAGIQQIDDFLADRPDAGNINGSPETTAAKFLLNGGMEFNANSEVYFNAAYVYKKVNSYANYRTPYWRTLSAYPYLADFFGDGTPQSYVGYVPTFDGDLNDYNATMGFKSSKNGWNTDASLTIGGNQQTYTVRNSHNRNTAGVRNPDTYLGDLNTNGVVDANEMVQGTLKYLENSPVTFRAGGTRFNHIVGNIDATKALNEKISLSFGSEFRSETFETIEGDLASYEAGGADSFAGNSAENSFISNRYNIGAYLGFGFDISEDFLIDATGRLENYSDFGDAFVYKLSSRYKLAEDKVTLRASYSTGFRAPSLHQIYTQKAQYSFVPGAGIQVSGLVNNVSREANLLGVPDLDAEKSTNFTAGIGLNPTSNLSLTLDFYSINMTDRIVLSTDIGPSAGPSDLNDILSANGIGSLSFFSNSMDTKTSGIDLVAGYRNIELGSGTLAVNLAGNYQLVNERDGAVNNPQVIEDAGQSVLNATIEALTFTSRPKYKAILGFEYSLNKFLFTLNGTTFGPTEFRNAGMDEGLKVEFKTKMVTDLGIIYQMNPKTTLALNVNNLFNVLPEWEFKALDANGEAILEDDLATQAQSNLITFNQRYNMVTYDGSHFSQLGTIVNFALNIKF